MTEEGCRVTNHCFYGAEKDRSDSGAAVVDSFPRAYMVSISSWYFSMMTRRLIFRVGVISPASWLKGRDSSAIRWRRPDHVDQGSGSLSG